VAHYDLLAVQEHFVLVAVVDDISIISSHLEKVSTAVKKVFPINGPVKSKCILTQGLDGQIHRCSGAATGVL